MKQKGRAPHRDDEVVDEAARDEAAERFALLEELQHWLELPMLALAFVWLALFVVEVVWGLNPLLVNLGYVIWGLFVLQFALELTVVPAKLRYVRHNWLTVVALLAPGLRMLRVLKVARVARVARVAGATRGARLVRVLSSLNRGMRALRTAMSRRGFGYVVTLTLIVDVAGAAGMYAFEGREAFESYASALWWTSMLITTICVRLLAAIGGGAASLPVPVDVRPGGIRLRDGHSRDVFHRPGRRGRKRRAGRREEIGRAARGNRRAA